MIGHVFSHRWPKVGRRQLRVGLQSKSVLVLTLVVVTVTAVGGWLYFQTTSQVLRARDRDDADKLSYALATSAGVFLRTGQTEQLQSLAENFATRRGVDHVVVINAAGWPAARASRRSDPTRWQGLTKLPVSIRSVQQVSANVLTIARPVVNGASQDGSELLGGVRLVLDTTSTSIVLAGLRSRIILLGCVVIVCAVPMAYGLVWRVLLSPVGKLVKVTRRLASGDFSARCGFGGNDEIGHLGYAFDVMAEDIARMRLELIAINEGLEDTVAERTDELQEANGRLREEMIEKEDFLRAVSHDLNAPLRNIAGMASMVLRKGGDSLPEELTTCLERIQANVKLETELIGDLLELSRAWTESRQQQDVDIGELIDEVVDSFDFDLRERHIEVVRTGKMPTLYGDRNRLRQVFQNLIDNAIKYMDKPSGGRIEITAERTDRWHNFTVADNGPGIPADQLKKVFYVFRRADSPATAAIKGKGVGLALVKAVAAKYGGRAYVTSEPGHGATFHVELPVETTTATQEAAHDEARV